MIKFPDIDPPTPEKGDFQDTRPKWPVWEDTNFKDTELEALKPLDERPASLVVKEAYPRIHAQIVLLWGTQELQDKFSRWLLTDQEGRQGWPTEVYSALFTLANSHAAQFGLEGNPVFGQKPDRW